MTETTPGALAGEANVRDALNRLLKDGEVYLPAEGRVRVTPR
jgi:hypothetical protein